MMRTIKLLLLACGLVTFPAAMADDTGATAPVDMAPVKRSCALLISGSLGSSFISVQADRLWTTANSKIADVLYQHLMTDRVMVSRLTITADDNVSSAVGIGLVKSKCDRIIQLSHTVSEDGGGKFFQFKLQVMRIQPADSGAAGTNVKIVGEYAKQYRHPRDDLDAVGAFNMRSFADMAYADMKSSGVLEALRSQ